ncbi:MAG TPA: hypothetical protein VK859_01240 [bacterium]|jgi:hypothetical protein|nr:hypothetical protein [bacterium]
MALFLLAASCGWAMPEKRKHTRPPYVGPRKTVEGIWRPFQPTVSNNAKPAARPSGLYGHIVVR